MAKVFVGNLEERVSEKDLEAEFAAFGPIRSVWVARRPPGYAFIEFQDRRDALDSIRELDGRNGWRVELSHSSKSGDGGDRGDRRRDRDYARGGGGGGDKKCFECGQPGHFARDCKQRGLASRHSPRRRRSPSPRYRSSPSYATRRSPSPRARRTRSRSRSRSRSPRKAPSRSPSPPPYRRSSPLYTSNGNSDRARRSRS